MDVGAWIWLLVYPYSTHPLIVFILALVRYALSDTYRDWLSQNRRTN